MNNNLNDNLPWLRHLKSNIKKFLDDISEDEYSYFRYSFSGDIYNKSKKWGLGNLVFAVKILYITGLLDEISSIKKENLSNSILKFCDDEGYIYDPLITNFNLREKFFKILYNTKNVSIKQTRTAETRQSVAALYLLKKKLIKPFVHIPYTTEGINKYLSDLNWSLPWGAASHFSHLLFFLNMNAQLFNYKTDESTKLIKYAFDWVKKIQSKEDGSFYIGDNIPLLQKINGLMKIFTGLHAADINEIPYPKKIIDTALSGINDTEACDNFNIVYVLYSCSLVEPEYRRKDMFEFLKNRVNLYRQFFYSQNGGFSFFINKANQVYYGKKITNGKNEPDIHGTNMFLLGIAYIDKLLNLGLNYKIPIN